MLKIHLLFTFGSVKEEIKTEIDSYRSYKYKKKAGMGYCYQIKLKSRPDTLKSAKMLFFNKNTLLFMCNVKLYTFHTYN